MVSINFLEALPGFSRVDSAAVALFLHVKFLIHFMEK